MVTSSALRAVLPGIAFLLVSLFVAPLRAQVPVEPAFSASGSVSAGTFALYQVTIPAGQQGWRLRLSGSAAADLYLRKDQAPTPSSFFRRSQGSAAETLILTPAESTAGTWFVGVYLPNGGAASADFTLTGQTGWFDTLGWDDGATDAGTVVANEPDTRGGLYVFRVTPAVSVNGAWRTRLVVHEGEAHLYATNNATTVPGPTSYVERSIRPGSDGWYRSHPGAGSPWILTVEAGPGARWTLLAGDAHAVILPDPATVTAGNAVTPFTLPPEGVRLFRATTDGPASALEAWRLWAYQPGEGGSATTLALPLAIRKSNAPVATNRDHAQPGQLLVVPPYLAGASTTYYLSVVGEPSATPLALDSRPQPVVDLPFRSFAGATDAPASLVVPASTADQGGYGYRTFRVQVPIDQLGWEVTLEPTSGTPVGVAVARGQVPSEWTNDAFAEGVGGRSSLTLSPTTLVDGTWYVTAYGTGPWQATLSSRPPAPPAIPFSGIDATTAEPGRPGWHYFVLTDIPSQLGALGWELKLDNAVAGAEIAVRRNALPTRWTYRSTFGGQVFSNSSLAAFSTTSLLQRPSQPADIWYVGIHHPTQPIGAFALDSTPIEPVTQPIDGDSDLVANLVPGAWAWRRYEIPEGMLGWEIRVADASVAGLNLQVRRGQLPPDGQNISDSGADWILGGLLSGKTDLADRSTSADGARSWEGDDALVLSMGRPLVPGIYFVGVRNDASVPASFRLRSRGIGTGRLVEPVSIAYEGGSIDITNLAPRDFRVVAIDIPEGRRSWLIQTTALRGEHRLHVARGTAPGTNTSSISSWNIAEPTSPTHHVAQLGGERFLLLPESGDTLRPGLHYVTLVSEGEGAISARIGSGSSDIRLVSVGEAPLVDLGTVGLGQTVTRDDNYASGEVRLVRFTLPAGLKGLEVALENIVGDTSPLLSLAAGLRIPAGSTYYSYGFRGGSNALAASASLIVRSDPAAGTYTLAISSADAHFLASNFGSRAGDTASFRLRVTGVDEAIAPLDGANISVADHAPGTWRYYKVTVPTSTPESPLLAWEVWLEGMSNGFIDLSVRRDLPPPGGSLVSLAGTTWASGAFTTGRNDLTDRTHSADGTRTWDSAERLLLPIGRPLVPGTYIVGIQNNGSAAASWTLRTRAWGAAYGRDPQVIAFDGGSATVTDLAARDLAVFAVDVPAGQRSWVVTLDATRGESRLLLAGGAFVGSDSSVLQTIGALPTGTQVVAQGGSDQFVLLPASNQDFIAPGRYHVAVVSEGVSPTGNRIGTGTIDATLTSRGNHPVTDLGSLDGTAELAIDDSYGPGGMKTYRFTLPSGLLGVEIALENVVGDTGAQFGYLRSERIPYASSYYAYAPIAGAAPTATSTGLVTLSAPAAGTYLVTVSSNDAHALFSTPGSRVGDSASYRLRVTSLEPQPLAFDGGLVSVAAQPGNSWRYYRVVVPASTVEQPILGWELRALEATSSNLEISVRRDLAPPGGGLVNPTSTTWASGSFMSGHGDLTGRQYSADGVRTWDGSDTILVAHGSPLAPGTYIVGVNNQSTTTTLGYTLRTRGIGPGLSLPVTAIEPIGGESTALEVAPRDLRFYSVQVPAGQTSWRFEVEALSGEVRASLRLGLVPAGTGSVLGRPEALPSETTNAHQLGSEWLTILPSASAITLPPGTYHVAVVAEGQNPANANRIGTGTSSWTFRSLGPVPTPSLGTLAPGDTVSLPVTIPAGGYVAAAFATTADVLLVDARLADKVGDPMMSVGIRSGSLLPFAHTGYYTYAPLSGPAADVSSTSVASRVNPPAGQHRVAVAADTAHYLQANPGSRQNPATTGTLIVRAVAPMPLAFDPTLAVEAGAGVEARPATRTGTLLAGERSLFAVDVPDTFGGETPIGWILDLEALQGTPTFRAHHAYASIGNAPGWNPGERLVTTPFLRPGRWIVEVSAGSGSVEYRLSSRAATLRRPAWSLPAATATISVPGLSGPEIGDSGIGPDGTPLPGDRGIDIGGDDLHFYAVDVDPANAGLLRTELIALNGNPNLYLKVGSLPSVDHSAGPTSWGGTSFERSMVGTGTEYASWVPVDGRLRHVLPAGRTYLAVRGVGSNVRYRLRLTAGNVQGPAVPVAQRLMQDLPVDGTTLSGQNLAAKDWRYYRLRVPSDPVGDLRLTFAEASGNVVMYVRHGTPPGNDTAADLPFESAPLDWTDDNENFRPVPGPWDSPGPVTLGYPALRPGEDLVIGFLAKTDANFSVSASWTGTAPATANPPSDFLPFAGGTASITLPAGGRATWRIAVPADATRWKHVATHAADVQTYLEQGTWAPLTANAHRRTTSANTSFNQYLDTWPWLPGQTWYFTAVNTAAAERTFTLVIDGRDATTDDDDNDGMLDAWERLYFGNTFQGASTDTDGDGLPNLREFQQGTNPTDPLSARYSLAVTARGGSVAATPEAPLHDRGSVVTLAATPTSAAASPLWWRHLANPFDRNVGSRVGRRVTGELVVPAAGTTTFALRYTGAVRLRVGDATVIEPSYSFTNNEALAAVVLPQGRVPFEIVTAHYSSSDTLELSTAPGSLSAFDAGVFRLVGDTARGGLAVVAGATPDAPAGVRVEVAEIGTNLSVDTVAEALDVISGTLPRAWRADGVTAMLDLRDNDGSAGRFTIDLRHPRVFDAGGASTPIAMTSDLAVESVMGLTPIPAIDAVNLAFTRFDGVPWLGIEDVAATGGAYGRSGWVDANGRSELLLRVDGAGVFALRWRLANTSGSTATLTRVTNGGTPVTLASLSGTNASSWTDFSVQLPAGAHELRLTFRRGGDAGSVEDHLALDAVSFEVPPTLAEALDAPLVPWQTAGNQPWLGTRAASFDGVDSARSGDIDHGQASELSATLQGPGLLRFRWRVSSETTRDALAFSVGGVERARISGTAAGWVQRAEEIPAGAQTVLWRYAKDGSGDVGEDAGYVDTVEWIPGSFAGFLALYGLSGDAALPGADPDGDGVVNLAEYLFGLDPNVRSRRLWTLSSDTGLPLARLVDDGAGGQVLEVVFARRKDAAAAIEVRFGGSPGATGTPGTPVVTPIDAVRDLITVRDPAPGPNRFATLLMTLAP